jgi:HAD superfamily phosphatase
MSAIVLFDIDGVIRDVGNSYRRALADTVEKFTQGGYRPTPQDIDRLKGEGIWNNDWEASQELIYRYFEQQGRERARNHFNYDEIVGYFQSKYRGTDLNNPANWDGYIRDEPLLANLAYFDDLTNANIAWGFFSGATRGSASFILQTRLGLTEPVLIAMEDAPGKPDPTGLFMAIERLKFNPDSAQERMDSLPIIYVGDTVADMHTVIKAKAIAPDRHFIGVGVLPPHVHQDQEQVNHYKQSLDQAGAQLVLDNVQELTPSQIDRVIGDRG